jgi:rfaE bifunctional protein nucleotidyltransferase chain/domain
MSSESISPSKLVTVAELAGIVERLQSGGGKAVFTNGVFDIMHAGHVRYLAEARALGDILIVAANTDESVRRLKGPLRPIIAEGERAELLSALTVVDYVVLFDTPTPVPVIEQVRPLVYVKGGDYAIADLPEAPVVIGYGGEVKVLSLFEGLSTTNIIKKICLAYGGGPT